MGEIFYEGNKKYNCRKAGKPYFRISAIVNGKQRDFYGDGEKDAKKKRDEALALESKGLDFDKRNAKVGATFKDWLFNIKRVDKNLKASSFARYEGSFRLHVEPYPIAQLPLSKLDSPILQAYVTALVEEEGLSNGNITAVIKIWKMFCSWAHDEGYLLKNPCRNLVVPGKRDKGKKEVETFTAEERKKIADYMVKSKYEYDTVILLDFATGMRLGELLELKWSDISEDLIHVRRSTAMVTHVDKDGNRERYREEWDTKTVNSVRNIPMLPSTAAMLREHRRKQYEFFGYQPEYVFTTNAGKLVDPTSFRKSYQRMLARAEVPYRKFHCIRHTFATEAIRRGVNVKDLQMLMGHSDIETTYIYVHASEDSKRGAIALMGNII